MPSTQTTLFAPPIRGSDLPEPLQKYLFTLQNLLPLRLADTSAGSYAEALPPAGLNATTGQSNQNQEIIYLKTTADANTFQITGAITGSVTLSTQYAGARFKSDGTNWWAAGSAGSSGGGGGTFPVGSSVMRLPPPVGGLGNLAGNTIVLRIPAGMIGAIGAGVKVGMWFYGLPAAVVITAATIAATLPNPGPAVGGFTYNYAWTTAPIAFAWPAGSFAANMQSYLSNRVALTIDTSHDYYIMFYLDPTNLADSPYFTTGNTELANLGCSMSGNHTNDADASTIAASLAGNTHLFNVSQVLIA